MSVVKQQRNKKHILNRKNLFVELKKSILDGSFPIGKVLPTEAELISSHGLTRYAVREALGRLTNEGLIERTPGKGSIVIHESNRLKMKYITFLAQDPRDWLASGIAAGIQDFLSSSNGDKVKFDLRFSGDTQQEFDRAIEALIDDRPEGMIILPLPWLNNHEWAYKIKQLGIPLVSVVNYPEGVDLDRVQTDNEKGGRLAAQELIKSGYKRLYYFGPHELGSSGRARFDGFLKTATEKNSEIDGKNIKELNIHTITQANISRVHHKNRTIPAKSNTILHFGDLISVIGTASEIEKLKLLVGSETKDVEIFKSHSVVYRDVYITEKSFAGKSLSQLQIHAKYGVIITRIRRDGLEFSPTADSVSHLNNSLNDLLISMISP